MRLRLPRWAAVTAALAVLAGAGTWTAVADDEPPPVHRADRMIDIDGARLDTSYFTAGGARRRPAVLLGHGFGGSKDDVRAQAEQLARDGYAVLTWSARGFGEVHRRDRRSTTPTTRSRTSGLIDWLAARPEVQLDRPATRASASPAPRTAARSRCSPPGTTGGSTPSPPQITYWNLADALFPDGVFKKLWAGIFFTTGRPAGCASTGSRKRGCATDVRAGRRAPGKPDAAARRLPGPARSPVRRRRPHQGARR